MKIDVNRPTDPHMKHVRDTFVFASLPGIKRVHAPIQYRTEKLSLINLKTLEVTTLIYNYVNIL
jgi:hypothetical protein